MYKGETGKTIVSECHLLSMGKMSLLPLVVSMIDGFMPLLKEAIDPHFGVVELYHVFSIAGLLVCRSVHPVQQECCHGGLHRIPNRSRSTGFVDGPAECYVKGMYFIL